MSIQHTYTNFPSNNLFLFVLKLVCNMLVTGLILSFETHVGRATLC